MRGQIRNAANGIALYFDIWRLHLLDQRCEATKHDDCDFVFRCTASAPNFEQLLFELHTVDSQITESGARRTLDFDVSAVKQEQDWLERLPSDFSDVYEVS